MKLRVQPAESGKCFTYDPNSTDPRPKLSEVRLCGIFSPAGDHNTEVYSITIPDLCRQFSRLGDRPYIDKTGLTDKYDIRFENNETELAPSEVPTALIDLIAVHLNLKIRSAKGAQERMVIDRVERPSSN